MEIDPCPRQKSFFPFPPQSFDSPIFRCTGTARGGGERDGFLRGVLKIRYSREMVRISIFVYSETMKREINKRLIYECRCDERLKCKGEGSTYCSSDTLG